MPCYDPQAAEDDRHNSALAQMFCKWLQDKTPVEMRSINLSTELRIWWEDHKERDKQWRR